MAITAEQKEKILDIDVFDGDFGDSGDTILADKIVKARKAHRCIICKEQIITGDYYRTITHICDGELNTNKYCIPCLLSMMDNEHENGCEGGD